MSPTRPRWTRKRLERMLGICYGRTITGHVDVHAVADVAGVTVRTVQRWMSGSNRRKAAIPPPRLVQLFQPAPDTERRAQQAADYARDAIEKIALPKGRGVLPAWRSQGWLEPHVVLVLHLSGLQLFQAVITKAGGRAMEDIRRRGTIIDLTTVPTKFHATVLVNELLTRVEPWRVVPTPKMLATGRTQVWADDSPRIDLSVLAVSLELR